MGILKDTKASLERIPSHANQIKSLLSRHEVHSIDDLKRVAQDSSFKNEVAALWDGVLKAEGGKITLTILLSTIALAMGGVGIAAGGGAIGLPLLAILAPVGYFSGQELDSEGYTKVAVDTFKDLLQKAQTIDSKEYTEVVANKSKNLLEKIQRLDSRRYTEAAVDRVKKLLYKESNDPSSD
jgi:hypothetical protein